LEGFNQSIESILDENIYVRDGRIDIVIDVICNHYNLNKREFLSGRGKGKISEARKYAYCILYNEYKLPIRYIASRIFRQKWHTSVSIALSYYRSLNKDLKMDREFMDELDKLIELIKNKQYDK
jgi:chromosomal replication initiation ATPase DnaA